MALATKYFYLMAIRRIPMEKPNPLVLITPPTKGSVA
jgi:hypothetical protein